MQPIRPPCALDRSSMQTISRSGFLAGRTLQQLLYISARRAVVACQQQSSCPLRHGNALAAAGHAAKSWNIYGSRQGLLQVTPCSLASVQTATATAEAPLAVRHMPGPMPLLQPSQHTLQPCLQEVFLQAAPGTTLAQRQASAKHLDVHTKTGDSWVFVECGEWVPAAAGGLQGPARAVLQVVPAADRAAVTTPSSGKRTRRPKPFTVTAFKLDRLTGLPTGECFRSPSGLEAMTSKKGKRDYKRTCLLLQDGQPVAMVGQLLKLVEADASRLSLGDSSSSSSNGGSMSQAVMQALAGRAAASPTRSSSSSNGRSSSSSSSSTISSSLGSALREPEAGEEEDSASSSYSGSSPAARTYASARKGVIGMDAATTSLVRNVWQNYFSPEHQQQLQQQAEQLQQQQQQQQQQLEAAGTAAGSSSQPQQEDAQVTWLDAISSTDSKGRQLHSKAQLLDGSIAEAGQAVQFSGRQLATAAGAAAAAAAGLPQALVKELQQKQLTGLLQCMWETEAGTKMAQVRLLLHGTDTLLGDAAAEAELFLTNCYIELPLQDGQGVAAGPAAPSVFRLQRPFGAELRLQQQRGDEELAAANAAAREAGRPVRCFYRHRYLPEEAMFAALPADLGFGAYAEPPEQPVQLAAMPNGEGFIKQGIEYRVGDFMYINNGAASRRAAPTKGSLQGLKAWQVARLLAVDSSSSSSSSSASKHSKSGVRSLRLRLRPYFRPEDISRELAYTAGLWDLYAPAAADTDPDTDIDTAAPAAADTDTTAADIQPGAEDTDTSSSSSSSSSSRVESSSSSSSFTHSEVWVNASQVVGKCAAKAAGTPHPAGCELLDCFIVQGSFDPSSQQLTPPPTEFDHKLAAAATAEGINSHVSQHQHQYQQQHQQNITLTPLASLDIFAGCGGLSEGLHQAGVADSRWAIEFEQPAADAFALNNPAAAVFTTDCNAILLAAMRKAGQDDDCTACSSALAAADALPAAAVDKLPLPGEVDLICGGPPCQGFSGLNKNRDGEAALNKNSMVISFLSFADFYRPRYFLLENVKTFVTHNSSMTLRLALRSLLDMGYQVRVGLLNAAHFGVPQSRTRTFIWAAAPEEQLPDWPQPRHAYWKQHNINLPGGVAYSAVDTSRTGAPLRPTTVQDAIGDLPPISNGDQQWVMGYPSLPQSAYQAAMRAQAQQLLDHACKALSADDLERCTLIPKDTPGADWRSLEELVAAAPDKAFLSSGRTLVPEDLVRTRARNNEWKGLYGRVDACGCFGTVTTEPGPKRKQGQVLHYSQDRMLSVREFARAQGFPDHYLFSGRFEHRHRQIGNAVPPPLAAALGRQLRVALLQGQQQQEQQQQQQQNQAAAAAE